MFALTREEQIFIVCLLVAILLGTTVKSQRERYRLAHPTPVFATPKPSPGYIEIREKRPLSRGK